MADSVADALDVASAAIQAELDANPKISESVRRALLRAQFGAVNGRQAWSDYQSTKPAPVA